MDSASFLGQLGVAHLKLANNPDMSFGQVIQSVLPTKVISAEGPVISALPTPTW